MRILLHFTLLLFLLIPPLVVRSQTTVKEKVVVTDLTRIKQIGTIAMSPDGKKAIFAVKTSEPNEENKLEYDYRVHVYLTDFQSVRQLTRGSESVSSAIWSPDSKQIAFARNIKGKSQIFVMPLDGGEAFQLTDSKYGASNPNWSKDGSKISFSTSISLTELLKDETVVIRRMNTSYGDNIEVPSFKIDEHYVWGATAMMLSELKEVLKKVL